MQHSDAPWNALKRARDALDNINAMSNPAEQAECWQDFLIHLERIWNKAEAHFSKSPKWGGWCSPYARLRKKDPLLSYLRHARNADEHTTAPISMTGPRQLRINPISGSDLYIKKLESINGRITLETDAPVRFRVVDGKAAPIAVTDKNVEYAVPTVHLGQPFNAKFDRMAELALAFYEDALTKAEEFFVR